MLLCPFWVNRIKALPTESPSAIRLGDILHCDAENPDERWTHVVLANYLIDPEWLLRVAPAITCTSRQLFIITGERGFAHHFASSTMAAHMGAGRVTVIEPPMPLPFGVHHTKLVLGINSRGLRVAVLTANFIEEDWDMKAQGIYMQDFPRSLTPDKEGRYTAQSATLQEGRGERFRSELRRYLHSYGLLSDENGLKGIPPSHFDGIDFSSASVELIASVPGYHRGGEAYSFGMGRLLKVVQSVQMGPILDGGKPILTWQFSSQGLLTEKFLKSLEDAMLGNHAVGATDRRPEPEVRVVYPTESEVKNSLEGWRGGMSLPVRLRCCHPYINARMHRWCHRGVSEAVNKPVRGRAMPHLKTYMRLAEGEDSLHWFLLTSANLSRAAWGEWQRNGSQLAIRSYELGVLYDSKSFINCAEGELFVVTPSRRIPLPSSVEGDGLLRLHIRAGANDIIGEAPVLFLPYDALHPEPYESTLQLRKNHGSSVENESHAPLSTKDVPWVVDAPHHGRDALGKKFLEAVGCATKTCLGGLEAKQDGQGRIRF
ncbi:putative tyrosyl-DNA Phosphodiesterase (Tdp1) [Trypanosoma vivax]|nr:putative tyrosyl-DNA Phosphodiesterase (Tdp1) [Trypanosoma vivax]